jgi:hypothetical protein
MLKQVENKFSASKQHDNSEFRDLFLDPETSSG